MTRQQTLETAAAIVGGARQTQYGSPEDSFATIADFWTVYLRSRGVLSRDATVTPDMAGMMMALLKIARSTSSPEKADHYVDCAGYAACVSEIMTRGQDVPAAEK